MSYKPYSEIEPVMLSALEHYSYCPRQCALIHVEQAWDENIYTMRGRHVHETVDIESTHEGDGVRSERALPIWSKRLKLVGKADLVEFCDNIPCPVEYKSGKHRKGQHEILQLCAQAICLEEMLNVSVDKGAIYWHASRERREIIFTPAMRERVATVATAVHDIIARQYVPPPVNDKRCKDCSLNESCMPAVVGDKESHRRSAREMFVISGGKEF
ncbi:MAG: CRISPR-associated protein Cas4 [Nitrospirae bacterium]|nr:CRISPR-associated protein Cas4 [Nitrospirota bacterium]